MYQALTGMGTERQSAYDAVEASYNAGKQGDQSKTQVQNRMLRNMEIAPEEQKGVPAGETPYEKLMSAGWKDQAAYSAY